MATAPAKPATCLRGSRRGRECCTAARAGHGCTGWPGSTGGGGASVWLTGWPGSTGQDTTLASGGCAVAERQQPECITQARRMRAGHRRAGSSGDARRTGKVWYTRRHAAAAGAGRPSCPQGLQTLRTDREGARRVRACCGEVRRTPRGFRRSGGRRCSLAWAAAACARVRRRSSQMRTASAATSPARCSCVCVRVCVCARWELGMVKRHNR